MERLVRSIGGAVIRWVEMTLTPADQRGSVARGHIWEQVEEGSGKVPLPDPEKEPLFTAFYPPRIGADPYEAGLWTGTLVASMERLRRQQLGQPDPLTLDEIADKI